MKAVKSFFLILALSILSYSAVQAGVSDEIIGDGDAGRTCCQYQVDCPESQTCEYIFPYCSADKNYICKGAKVE
ncbi:MAG TPA: hypothetical protein VFY60_18220 [Pyrinomonadaceae bacterium]|nr:hypothetical protein [Pyrinomonadaceae bacterium]